MPWYGWLFLVLWIVTVAVLIIYALVKRPKTPDELRKKLEAMDLEYKSMKRKLDAEKLARQKAEGERATAELAKLELEHSEKLKALEGKERDDFEAAKHDPESGVSFIRGLLGDDEPSGGPS